MFSVQNGNRNHLWLIEITDWTQNSSCSIVEVERDVR